MAGLLTVLFLVGMLSLGFPLWVFALAALLRICSSLVGGPVPGWGMAVVVVVVATLVQGAVSGLFAGADGGTLGAIVGFCAWSMMHAFLTGTSFGRSAVIGLTMAVVQLVLTWIFVILGLGTLLVGLAAASLPA
jgi:hypothetical protein